MRRNRLYLFPLIGFLAFWGFGSSNTEEIGQIDAQIEQLEQQKLGFEGRALKHDYYAEYLQFNDKTTLEFRRHLQLADENRMKAAYTQARIDELKAKRDRLKK